MDFQPFKDVTAPLLKVGYFGIGVYFALQWNMYRNINSAVKQRVETGEEAERRKRKGGDRE